MRKVEYIPENVLPDVLTEVFRAGFDFIIGKQMVKEKQEAPPAVTLEALMAAVANLQQSSRPEVGELSGGAEKVNTAVEIVPVMPEVDENDEDLGDLLGMLK